MFYLWFAIIFTEKEKVLKNNIIYFVFFALPLLFIYKNWTGFLINDYIRQPWGWEKIWSDSLWTYSFFLYYPSCSLIALYLIYDFSKKKKMTLKGKQSRIIFYTSLISLTITSFIDILLPLYNVDKFPPVANVAYLILIGGIIYAIVKYRFIPVTPHMAAEQIISTMADSLVLLDKNCNIASVNQAFINLTGYENKELLGKTMELFIEKTILEKMLTDIVSQKKSKKEIEMKLQTKSSSQISALCSCSPVIDDSGELAGIVCIFTEITELEKAKKILLESQEESISLFQNSPLAGLYQDENGIILDINKKFTELFGYSREELKGKNINEGFIFPEERIVLESDSLTQKSLANGHIQYETIRKKKDGTIVPVVITVSSIIVKDKRKAIVAFYQDISKEKEFLDKLKQSESKYRDLFENIPAAYYQTDKDGNIVMMNPAGIVLLGYQTLDEILGRNIAQDFYYKSEDRIKFLEALNNNGGQIEAYKVVLKDKDGKILPVSTNSRYYYHESGEIAGVEGIVIDIRERIKSEETLRKSQQEFASLFQSHSEAILYLDSIGTVLNANKRFTELFGYTLEEIKGKNINYGSIVPPDKRKEGEELDKRAVSQDHFQFETFRQKKDGTLIPVSISSSPVLIDGEIKGIITSYVDITERKKMEEQLQKMARIDNLTGCFNRGCGLELLERQMNLAKRNKSPLLIAFLDINHLKLINDLYGHQEGDLVIKMVGNLLKSTLREVDIICRMGGDEFLLAFPDSSLRRAPLIQKRLEEGLFSLNKSIKKGYQIEFSIGFSEYLSSESKSSDELIKIADQQMYEDKRKRMNK